MAITKKQLKELRKINKMNEKELKTITMADLGNHVACYDCKHKDKRIAELEKELAELKAQQKLKELEEK